MVTDPPSSTPGFPLTATGTMDVVAALYTAPAFVTINTSVSGATTSVALPTFIDPRAFPPPLLTSGRPDLSAGDLRASMAAALDSLAITYSGSAPALISEATRYYASIDVRTPVQVQVAASTPRAVQATLPPSSSAPTVFTNYLTQPRALIKKIPGFFFSSYRQTVRASPILVRMEDYSRFLRDAYTAAGYPSLSPALVPKQKLLV